MSISKATTIWRRLTSKAYRDAYTASRVSNEISSQVYYLREQRDWTQTDLAERAGTKQPAVSRIEKAADQCTVSTLLKFASAFDVSLVIRFVSHSKALTSGEYANLDVEIPSFEHDRLHAGLVHAWATVKTGGGKSAPDLWEYSTRISAYGPDEAAPMLPRAGVFVQPTSEKNWSGSYA